MFGIKYCKFCPSTLFGRSLMWLFHGPALGLFVLISLTTVQRHVLIHENVSSISRGEEASICWIVFKQRGLELSAPNTIPRLIHKSNSIASSLLKEWWRIRFPTLKLCSSQEGPIFRVYVYLTQECIIKSKWEGIKVNKEFNIYVLYLLYNQFSCMKSGQYLDQRTLRRKQVPEQSIETLFYNYPTWLEVEILFVFF